MLPRPSKSPSAAMNAHLTSGLIEISTAEISYELLHVWNQVVDIALYVTSCLHRLFSQDSIIRIPAEAFRRTIIKRDDRVPS
jgi:hypothetical protein